MGRNDEMRIYDDMMVWIDEQDTMRCMSHMENDIENKFPNKREIDHTSTPEI